MPIVYSRDYERVLKGKGIPAKEPGDLYLTIHIDLPQANSDADRAAWEQLAAHYGARG